MSENSPSNYQAGKWRNAMVILANWKDFVPGMTYSYKKVQSRFFIWSRYGSGTLVVNRRSYPFRQGDFLFLPWNHSISYKPDNDNPFSVGCIHVIPVMPEEDNIYYNPFHWERPEEPEYRARKDEKLAGFGGVITGHAAMDSKLFKLAGYIIENYQTLCPDEVLRTFPRLLLFELEREIQKETERPQDCPPLFTKVLDRLDFLSPDEKKSVKVIQKVCGLSPTSLYRIFRQYLNLTPKEYLMNRKMEYCAYLLRNTRLSNREIAQKIGVDVSYFARTFKKKYRLSPGVFRKTANPAETSSGLFRYEVKKIKQEFHADMKTW